MRPVPVTPADPVPAPTSPHQPSSERLGVGLPYPLPRRMHGHTRARGPPVPPLRPPLP